MGTGGAITSHRAFTTRGHPNKISENVGQVRTLGFPPAISKSPRNERHTVKTLMIPNPRHNPQLGLGLGERAKTFPLISFKNSN